MISADIVKKIREIEITTKRILTSGRVGESQSAIKGSGFDFDQIREYQMGDDVRCIDWKSSARTNKILVKQYIEERSRTIILAIDISSSHTFASGSQIKSDGMLEIGTLLTLVATHTKDSVGLLLFSDEVELFIPPGAGMSHAHALIARMYSHTKKSSRTGIASACQRIASLPIKNAIVFLISDFIDDSFEKALCIVAKQHDLIAVRCLDSREKNMPSIGFITVQDSETGQEYVLDLRSDGKKRIDSYLQNRLKQQTATLRQSGVDILDIEIGRPFFGDIVRFFKKRML